MDFSLPPDIIDLRDRTRAFVAEQIIPFERDPRIGAHGPSEDLRRELVALARAAGADATVDYRQADAAAQLREATQGQGVDRIVELDIGANAALDLDGLRPGGDLVVYGTGTTPFELPFFPLIAKNLNLRFFIVYHLTAADRQRAEAALTGWLRRDALQHNIAQRLPLAQIAQGHDAVAQGRLAGKLVLSIP